MTKDQALKLVRLYARFLHRIGNEDSVLTEIHTRFPDDGSKSKAMRWLGFMQGACYVLNVFDLNDVKNQSKYLIEDDEEALKAHFGSTVYLECEKGK